MTGSRHFIVNTIRNHLPETIGELNIEVAKWETIGYLLETDVEIRSIKNIDEINLLKLTRNHMDKKSLLRSLCEGALLIKGYIKASFADVYLIEEEKIYRLLYKQGYPSVGASWPVGPGTVVAAYVAFAGQTLILENLETYNLLYPLGTGKEPRPKHLISIPVLLENRNCMAVFEFNRITTEIAFTKTETNMCTCMVEWLGQTVITNKGPYAEIVESCNTLFFAFDRFHHDRSKPETFISFALEQLHKLVPMDKVNYYKITKDLKNRCRMFVQLGNDSWHCIPEYTLKNGDFIKEVADNHTVKNMTDKDIASLNGLIRNEFKQINSYLCVPIGIETCTVGVVELVNKKNLENFLDKDIREATRYGIYIAAALYYSDIYIKKQIAFSMCENHNQTLLCHMHSCSHDWNAAKYKITDLNMPESFFKLNYYPIQEELKNLTFYTWYIFREVFKVKEKEEEINKFLNFILMIKQGYRNTNAYHNFEHAFSFCHCMYIITTTNTDMFSNLEIRALITAGLCHDIDHPGITNKFIQDSGHLLTKLYNDSFLENHHASMSRMIVQYCGIFSDLSSEDYQSAIKMMNYCILATDLSDYFTSRYKLMDILTTNSFTPQDEGHKKLLRDILMTACDLNGQGKTFRVAERLCRNLYKEFYSESDSAAGFGIEPICVMDKAHRYKIPKYQIQFGSEVCLPCFYILSIIMPNTKELYNQCCDICQRWDEIITFDISWDVTEKEYLFNT